MRTRFVAAVLAWLVPTVTAADTLTVEQTFALAKTRAPQVLAAETSLAAERGARVGATPLFAENPSIEGGAGVVVQPQTSLFRDTRVGPSAWMQLSVPVEIALQRWRRVAAADARITARAAERDEARRLAIFAAGTRFYQAVYATQLVSLTTDSLRVAERMRDAAAKQLAVGSVSLLDVRIAELEVATVNRAHSAAEAGRLQALSDLASVLGMSAAELVDVRGDLLRTERIPTLAVALESVSRRPDVMMVSAERQSALQDANVASGSAFPSPRLKGYYQYWNTEHSMMALIEMPLPVFQRGQGEEGRARARASGLAAETQARMDAARAEVQSAHHLATTLEGLRLNQDGPVSLAMKDLPAELERHYAERRIELGTVLNVRRQVLQARREALDALLQEALARLWLDAATGVLK